MAGLMAMCMPRPESLASSKSYWFDGNMEKLREKGDVCLRIKLQKLGNPRRCYARCGGGPRGSLFVGRVEMRDSFDVETAGSDVVDRTKEKKQRAARKARARRLILKPPLDDKKLADRFLNSPQMTLKAFPLLSSCLPLASFDSTDHRWIDDNILEAKDALGLPTEPLVEPQPNDPASQLDSLLYLAFQHSFTIRGRNRYVGIAHSRLWFLGQYVVELAFSELFLQMFPRESVGALRERVFALTNKRALPVWFTSASLDNLVFPTEELQTLQRDEKQRAVRAVFWALVGALYLTLGMPEVYRFLFEVLGMDVDAENCQPKPRRRTEDIDHLSPELDGKRLTWQDICSYRVPSDALFAAPRLFRACVPPGMHRFHGSEWEYQSLPTVKKVLNYPLATQDPTPEFSTARNAEVELGLQLCFMHPSAHKLDHPRFCFDRLEYVGQKIQDVILAEKLLMKHLDGPALFLGQKHRLQLMNRMCGRILREKKLTWHIIYHDAHKLTFEKSRRLRNFATTGVQHAIHGLGYLVYGRSEVRRLMFKVFNVEGLVAPRFL